jgi:hypothetical protein
MQLKTDSCQLCSLSESSQPLPATHVLWHRLRWHREQHGISATISALLRRAFGRTGDTKPTAQSVPLVQIRSSQEAAVVAAEPPPAVARSAAKETPAGIQEVLNLQAGELVEVRSLDEIQATLDANGKLKGLDFMAEMIPYSGKRLRVRKRIELLRLENTNPPEVRKIRNTVILHAAICDGSGVECGRCCHFMWREAWLKRV